MPAGATGNVASEDLVSMLHEMGVATGIDLGALLDASRAAQQLPAARCRVTCSSPAPVQWGTPSA